MFLHRILLDPRCKETRRDLADPYQMHSTLCRAFSVRDERCPRGEFLWRLEPETDPTGYPRVIVQSWTLPDWTAIGIKGWFARADPAIDLKERLKLDSLKIGQHFRFRLRANPCVTRNGKRLALFRTKEQEKWIEQQGARHGFSLLKLASFYLSEKMTERVDVRISQEQMLQGSQRTGNAIQVFSVLYDGNLTVSDPSAFRNALQIGIGHGKAMGLGLLSAVPIAWS